MRTQIRTLLTISILPPMILSCSKSDQPQEIKTTQNSNTPNAQKQKSDEANSTFNTTKRSENIADRADANKLCTGQQNNEKCREVMRLIRLADTKCRTSSNPQCLMNEMLAAADFSKICPPGVDETQCRSELNHFKLRPTNKSN